MDVVVHEWHAASCHVLEEDADLAEVIPVESREEASRECLAETVTIPTGLWHGVEERRAEQPLGMLVLSGLLLRRVGVAGRFGGELLGSGDLLRPYGGDDEWPMLGGITSFHVLEPARLAVLSERFLAAVARHPQLASRLVERALRRSRNLAVNMAIVHQARVDVRLQMLFWHLAGRWGRVRSDSVRLPLRLTQDVLADLTAAQRPTVSSAMTSLVKRGLLRPEKGGWLLIGEPPDELVELGLEGPLGPSDGRLQGPGEGPATRAGVLSARAR